MGRQTSFKYDVVKAQALIESLTALKTQLVTAMDPIHEAIEPFIKVGVVFAEEDSVMEQIIECNNGLTKLEEGLQVKVAGLEALTSQVAEEFNAHMTINVRSTEDAMAKLKAAVAAVESN